MCNVRDAADTFTKTYLDCHYQKAKIVFCDVLFTSASLNASILVVKLYSKPNTFLRPIPSDTLQYKIFKMPILLYF